MPNPHRGEIEACLDGKSFRLCLTLSALAELEHAFNNDDMLALAERFQTGRLSARDARRIIGAGLRGAGHEILDDAVGRMQAEGGAAGFVDIVARLLSATFAGPAAPIVGAIAGEIVSGLTDAGGAGTFSSDPDTAPSGLPSPVHAEHGFAMTRGGGGGGGQLALKEGRTPPAPFPGTT